MPKKTTTRVLKTCRIERHYIEYCTMQGINFNGLVNKLLREFVLKHERYEGFRSQYDGTPEYLTVMFGLPEP